MSDSPLHSCIYMSSEFLSKVDNFYQISFLKFDVNVFKAVSSIQRFFNMTEDREVIAKNSLLIMHAGMQIRI